jgi:hypothetical protein
VADTIDEIPGSGDPDFDRARELLRDGRIDEALDWFEIASTGSPDPAVRASSCAYAAGVLLSLGRPWEVPAWAEMLRDAGGSRDLAAVLEASARLQLDAPADPWFPCSATTARVIRAHARYLAGDEEQAFTEVMDAGASDPYAPDVWDAIARFCAETDFDPQPLVDALPEDRVLGVLTSLAASYAPGVDRIASIVWERNPGDARVLAIVPRFAARLDSVRALEWSARLRAAGMGRTCPLLARAEDVNVDAADRVRAAALAHASFGDKRAREALERAIAAVPDDELGAAVDEVWVLARGLADSGVVAGATTSRRALRIAAVLYAGGAHDEAYAVLVHGLAMEDAETLVTEDVVSLLPLPALTGLAEIAERRGEDDVAGILEAVAVVAEH